jgi:benzoylformate decarboxylase
MKVSGIEALVHMLAEHGVRYVFGNPGTTELPLNDALVTNRRLQYILGLQEVPVVSMADGFSMASGKLGVVNLHVSCGLGNAGGMLYNAFREGTPLLVTAGQQDRRLRFEEPILWSRMVDVARPWTKWAVEVERVEDLPTAIRRAIQTALTPPTGPVFMSLPLDVQLEAAELDLTPPAPLDPLVRPPVEALGRAADVLLSAENPAILTGGRVVERGAVAELVRLAERLGAPVIGESGTTHGRLGFPPDHPLYDQCLPLWSPEIRERLAPYDVLFIAGMDVFRQYLYHEPRAIPEATRLVQLDEDPWQLGKNYPLEVGLIGGTKTGLAELDAIVAERMTAAQREAARRRGEKHAQRHLDERKMAEAQAEEQRRAHPLTPLGFMSSLARVLPPDIAVIEEAVTTTNTAFERLGALKNVSGYFGHRGWALGWGIGCAIGVKLAWPTRPVLGIIGDGSALYGIQALWSAARYRVPVTFVIPNNAQYQILKIGAASMNLPAARAGGFEGFDLTEPEIDFVSLARSLGVEASRISDPDELSERVAQSLHGDRPQVFEVPITRVVPNRLNY